MKKTSKMIDGERRGFLRQSAVVSGAVVAGGTLVADSAQADEVPSEAASIKKGYTESARVKAYYQRERLF